jgi:hypothetical protein
VATAEAAKARAPQARKLHAYAAFLTILSSVALSHAALLRLPYIWDEAGYYVPAARDLWLKDSLIPLSTVSNAHPPLVMMWVATWWKVFGYTAITTRLAVVTIAALTLFSLYRLARVVADQQVAIATTICTGCYSVFFMQSSLMHLDMAAAGFTLLALRAYLQDRGMWIAMWFSLAALAKETAILGAMVLLAWDLVWPRFSASRRFAPLFSGKSWQRRTSLLLPLAPLTLWFAYHYMRTGYVFGNPEFFRYNVGATMHPVRILLAAGIRLWQLIGYMHLWVLTVAAAMAMFLPPTKEGAAERPRIRIPVQLTFLVLIAAYAIAMSLVGGAVLARYMLPVVPLGILLCVSTLWRRMLYWHWVVLIIVGTFVMAWFINPPYGFSYEDNLAYRDYIELHLEAEHFVAARPDHGVTLTAWPASDEITRPYLGYVDKPMRVLRIEDFSSAQVKQAAESPVPFDTALIFSTKYLPPNSLLARWPAWERLQTRFFGFHRDLSPEVAARVLSGRVIYKKELKGQWIGIVARDRALDARLKQIGTH